MVRIVPPHLRKQLEERHGKIDVDQFWSYMIKLQSGMAKTLEENVRQARLEPNLQKMIKPYRQ